MSAIPPHFRLDFQPQAHPQAVVQAKQARFTILTERLIRLEYSPNAEFEDRPSQVFWFRRQPVPSFSTSTQEGNLHIETPYLHLVYWPGQPFTADSLSIEMREDRTTWHFGDPQTGDLGGTCRTLDQSWGPITIEPGLISETGWVVLDDTHSLVFNQQGWIEPRQARAGTLDLYFFGYGHAYQECLRDFRKLAGEVPLLPRWMLGNWWSRYWEYTQQELVDLVNDFETQQVPLSVCIIDMDWHITETGNQSSGWTGYTWNRALFPDPPALIEFLHKKGLRTALNLHPAEGIHPHEQMYPEMSRRLGLDTDAHQPIPFDIADPGFTQAYFELLHHPKEAEGVDFWWMDWQQGRLSRLPNLDPLWWLNHLHFYDLGRGGSKRPVVFSRWGGLGNHRYPIGFSGDTHSTWEALSFQPYFTATAANVGYGWWSHDIGGHMFGYQDAELYTRWVQYGLFSPILRLHSTKLDYHERRPWGFDSETLRLTRKAMQLRHAFIPYLYTQAWRDYSEGTAPVRPMYHQYPNEVEAYHCPNQYFFGSELVAAPFTQPRHPETGLSRQVVWLPDGDWFNFFDGSHYTGGWHAVYGNMEDIPVFARAGAILPLGSQAGWGGLENPEHLDVHIFPGSSNHFDLYEDDGETTGYRNGEHALTPFELEWSSQRLEFHIGPLSGKAALAPVRRTYQLTFHSLSQPRQVSLLINGSEQQAEYRYHPALQRLEVNGLALSPGERLTLAIESRTEKLAHTQDHTRSSCLKLIEAFNTKTTIQSAIKASLEEILSAPARLAAYRGQLSPTQLRALLETITQAGVEHITHAGQERVILWNNHQRPSISYQLSFENLRSWNFKKRFELQQDELPAFRAIAPSKDLHSNPWALAVHYWQVYTHTIVSSQDGAKKNI